MKEHRTACPQGDAPCARGPREVPSTTASQSRSTQGSWAVLCCCDLVIVPKQRARGCRVPVPALPPLQPYCAAGCYCTAKRLIFSFLPFLPSPIPLWLYRLVGWRAGRERGEERMGHCLLYVLGCWGWLWCVCTQRCLCAQGPVLQGAASHSWL